MTQICTTCNGEGFLERFIAADDSILIPCEHCHQQGHVQSAEVQSAEVQPLLAEVTHIRLTFQQQARIIARAALQADAADVQQIILDCIRLALAHGYIPTRKSADTVTAFQTHLLADYQPVTWAELARLPKLKSWQLRDMVQWALDTCETGLTEADQTAEPQNPNSPQNPNPYLEPVQKPQTTTPYPQSQPHPQSVQPHEVAYV